MPRPGRPMMEEKSKDFKGSMIRLLKNLTPWKVIMILALMLALISAILSLIAPNKLSEFADTISDGLVPNTKLLQEIGEETAKNIMKTDFANETPRLFEDINFSKEEKDKIVDILEKIPTTSPEEKLPLLLSFPEEALVYLINDIKVKKISIPISAKALICVKFLVIAYNMIIVSITYPSVLNVSIIVTNNIRA